MSRDIVLSEEGGSFDGKGNVKVQVERRSRASGSDDDFSIVSKLAGRSSNAARQPSLKSMKPKNVVLALQAVNPSVKELHHTPASVTTLQAQQKQVVVKELQPLARKGVTSDERAELVRLRKENKELRSEVARLKASQQVESSPRSAIETFESKEEHEKYDCPLCDKPLKGSLVRVNKTGIYHRSCFTCYTCEDEFTHDYWMHNDQPYCQQHYAEAADIRCARCDDFIAEDRVLTTGRLKWHANCFNCAQCHASFDSGEARELNGEVYCEPHYLDIAGFDCAGCKDRIAGHVVRAMGKEWHVGCLSCSMCKMPFVDGTGAVLRKLCTYGDQAYCKPCVSVVSSATCGRCRKGITGNRVQALGQVWHDPGCWSCHNCDTPLQDWYAFQDHPYCDECLKAVATDAIWGGGVQPAHPKTTRRKKKRRP